MLIDTYSNDLAVGSLLYRTFDEIFESLRSSIHFHPGGREGPGRRCRRRLGQ